MADYSALQSPINPANPSYDETTHKYAKELEKMRADSLNFLFNEEGWKPHSEKNGVNIHMQHPDGWDVPWVKGFFTFKAPLELCHCVIESYETRGEWDTQYIKSEPIEVLTPHSWVQYSQFSAPWPVSSRDFALLTHFENYPSIPGAFLKMFASVESDKAPVNSKFVRGTVNSCYILKPNQENPEHTDIIYVVVLNPCGSIPSWIVASSSPDLVAVLGTINKIIANKPEVVKKAVDAQQKLYAYLIAEATNKC